MFIESCRAWLTGDVWVCDVEDRRGVAVIPKQSAAEVTAQHGRASIGADAAILPARDKG